MKKILLVLFTVNLVFAGDVHLHMLTSGSPISTYYLGDKLNPDGTWNIQFEIGQVSWNASDAGIGKIYNDPSNWTWRTAVWYDNGEGSNKKVYSDFGDFQFNATGNWYINGRAKGDGGDPCHYANSTEWDHTGTFTATYFFEVDPLSNPTNISTSPQSNSDIIINWTRWEGRFVLIIRSLDNKFGTPIQGHTYSSGDNINDGSNNDKVILVGDGNTISGEQRTFTDTDLSRGTTYYYKIFSENYSYYSDGIQINESGDQSLPVTLSSFTAEPNNGSVLIKWTTESEVSNLGFNLYRADSKNGVYTQINNEFIKGAINSSVKNDYQYKDIPVATNKKYWYKLEDISINGNNKMHSPISVIIIDNLAISENFSLENCYPNPFNPITNIKFSLSDNSGIQIMVFDINGNYIKTLVNSNYSAGNYNISWNGTDMNNIYVSAGIYFCKMVTSDGYTKTTKMVLVK